MFYFYIECVDLLGWFDECVFNIVVVDDFEFEWNFSFLVVVDCGWDVVVGYGNYYVCF